MPLVSPVEIDRLRRTLRTGDRVAAGRQDFVMPPKQANRFPRAARLLRHADFERVYKQGRRHFSALMTFFYQARPESEVPARAQAPQPQGLRIGFTVGRALGGAVQRNRIKRRLREAVRTTRPVTGIAADVVINPKKSVLHAEFSNVLNEMSRAFAVIEEKLSQKNSKPRETTLKLGPQETEKRS